MKLATLRLTCCLGAAATLLLSSCSTVDTSGPVSITKVNPYHYKRGDRVRSDDEMITFEHRRYSHGVVDTSELKDRYGQYYSIFWQTNQPGSPVTVRLEYRQSESQQMVHTKQEMVASPKKKNVTKFQVTGDEYSSNGMVTQWKATVVQNGAVVAEYKSFLWK